MAQTLKKLAIHGGGVNDTFINPQIAPDFSTSTAYAIGKYVTYQGQTYRFTAAKTAGAWDSTKVTAVNLAGDTDVTLSIAGMAADAKAVGDKALIDRGYLTSTSDFDDATAPGVYFWSAVSALSGISHCPYQGSERGAMIVGRHNDSNNYSMQIVITPSRMWWRSKRGSTWSGWEQVANNDVITNMFQVMVGENMMDGVGETTGSYISASGVITSNQNSSYSNIIDVTAGSTYEFSAKIDPSIGASILRIHAYADGTWTSQVASYSITSSSDDVIRSKFTIPSGANGLRVSFGNRSQFISNSLRAFDDKGYADKSFMEFVSGLALNNSKYTQLLANYSTGITTQAELLKVTEKIIGDPASATGSADDMLPNSVIVIANTAAEPINGARVGGSPTGTYLTFHYKGGSFTAGGHRVWTNKSQIFINRYGMAFRHCRYNSGDEWSPWRIVSTENEVYYVGGSDDEYQSITELFIALAGNKNKKTIYIRPGTYDIYQEYRDAQSAGYLRDDVPAEEGTASTDYDQYCVFLPENTDLIGMGNVTLVWDPVAGDGTNNTITVGEAQRWSPLNIRGSCHVENITVICNNGRYAIHDETKNAVAYRDGKHSYKNVVCLRNSADSGYTRSAVFGFGLADRTVYEFDNCYLYSAQSGYNVRAFGCHDGSATNSSGVNDSPSLTFKNCVFITEHNTSSNPFCVRLQSHRKTSGSQQQIPTLFAGCYLNNALYLNDDSNGLDMQCFDVELINSGNPTIRQDVTPNPYPVKVFPPVS